MRKPEFLFVILLPFGFVRHCIPDIVKHSSALSKSDFRGKAALFSLKCCMLQLLPLLIMAAVYVALEARKQFGWKPTLCWGLNL